MTLAETHLVRTNAQERFNQTASNEIKENRGRGIIQELFVTCSVDRDRSYALTIDAELDNPFKVVDVRYDINYAQSAASPKPTGLFRVHLPQSSFLVQLSQRVRYDQCLSVSYILLAPNVNYELECLDCSEKEAERLEKIFAKRMQQFDSELDFMLSEKLLLGLQVLLDQQRIEIDTLAVDG